MASEMPRIPPSWHLAPEERSILGRPSSRPDFGGKLAVVRDPAGLDEIPTTVSGGGSYTGPIFLSAVASGVGKQSAANIVRGNNPYERDRPELERIVRDPTIAKAMDDYYARSLYARDEDYKGELGFYVMEDSSGRLSVQPYPIKRAWIDQEGPHTVPGEIPWKDRAANFLFNRKPISIFHPHPHGGRGWDTGPSPSDAEFAHDGQISGIVKAPDGLHLYGVPTPAKPAPYHGIFDWFRGGHK